MRRLAAIAEDVRRRFEPVFGTPRGRVQVILVDQTDLSNGWATPFPYDAIELTAVTPSAESNLGNTTDWLELVFTHEYTHILHLDRSRGFSGGVRRVFGRVPIAFPNLFLPEWQVEGIATFEESRMTGEGRIPAGDFRAIVDMAARGGRFQPIDRVSGGLTDWPGGQGAYAYGAYFHQYLADRFGPERLSRLADATAGRVPLFGAGAFKRVFGQSAAGLWQQFREAHERTVPASATDARATRLTRHGFDVAAPAVADDGTVYYRLSDPHRFPALMRLPPGGTPSRVSTRVLGNRTSVRGGWIVFDQLERVRSVALHSDLYAMPVEGGRVRRLTRGARAADPDLSPDRRTIACTVQTTGRRALALLDFSPAQSGVPRVIVDDPDADFTGPRWSPGGERLVAERRRPGAYDLVLIDPVSRTVRVLVSRTDARLVTPSWSRDGRSILFAADVGDRPFNIFAVDVSTGRVRQVTDTIGGAQFPELSADGTLTYVGYTPDGYDLFSVHADSSDWKALDFASPAAGTRRPSDGETQRTAELPSTPYRPLRTLAPTYWTPLLETDSGETVAGAATAMWDALGRHTYSVDAGWTAHRARPDWHAAYAYDRWRPTLFASYADDTDPVRGGEIRSRELFAGAALAFRRIRFSETLFAGFDAETDTFACLASCGVDRARADLRSIRGGWLHDSRRRFGYSISDEEGFAAEAAAETSRTALGSDADAGASIVDVRGFHRAFAPHIVVAARFAAAAAWGDLAVRRVFSAAGAGPASAGFDFGRDAIGLLRGFASEDVIGTRAAVANLDLRFPLARPQRGAGSWPVFLHSVHGAAFFDAGNAWDAGFRLGDVRTSVGGELSANVVLVHYLPLTAAGGAAWTRDPVAARHRAAAFARIGYAF